MLQYHWYEAVSSTQDIATAFYHEQACNSLNNAHVFIAGEQLAGKGRQGKTWHSPKGHFYSSFLLPKNRASFIEQAFICGLALHHAIIDFDKTNTYYMKWPNDIYSHKKKVAGLLLSVVDNAIIAGMGINCKELSHDMAEKATYMQLDTANFKSLATHIYKHYMHYAQQDWQAILAAWRQYHFPKNTEMLVGGKYKGLFYDINNEGALLISINGQIETIYAEDIGII